MKPVYIALIASCLMMLAACDNDENVMIPEKNPVEMSWDGVSINQEESPQWCMARSNHWIALSDYESKSQYFLTWEGGFVSGKKENAVLMVSSNGSKPVQYELATLEILSEGVNCTILFADYNGATGRFQFPFESL